MARSYDLQAKSGSRGCVVARNGRDEAVKVHQDVGFSLVLLPKDKRIGYSLRAGRDAGLLVIRDTVTLNNKTLNEGDGAAISK